jgi:hypothetical protein
VNAIPLQKLRQSAPLPFPFVGDDIGVPYSTPIEGAGDEKQGPVARPLSAAERKALERYFADLTCPECHFSMIAHRPGCSQTKKGLRQFKKACLVSKTEQFPKTHFPGTASQFASQHRLAVTNEWMRGWNACLDEIDRNGGFNSSPSRTKGDET